jgi:hypothetical protein
MTPTAQSLAQSASPGVMRGPLTAKVRDAITITGPTDLAVSKIAQPSHACACCAVQHASAATGGKKQGLEPQKFDEPIRLVVCGCLQAAASRQLQACPSLSAARAILIGGSSARHP